jgi:hypothetical protein
LKDLRNTGELFAYYNLLGANDEDQSGQQQDDLTIAAGATLERWGLRHNSGAPGGVALDMSAIDEFTIFFRLQGVQSTGADQMLFVFNRDYTSRDGAWAVWLDSNLACWCGYYNTTAAAAVKASTSNLTLYNDVDLQFHVDKKLTLNSISPYVGAALDRNNVTNQSNTDGSFFANENLLIGANLTGTNRFTGIVQWFGIHTRPPVS